jgi:hypothetical protein
MYVPNKIKLKAENKYYYIYIYGPIEESSLTIIPLLVIIGTYIYVIIVIFYFQLSYNWYIHICNNTCFLLSV